MRERLKLMAERIEAVLSLHHISSRVAGGTVTPRWILTWPMNRTRTAAATSYMQTSFSSPWAA